MFTRHLGGIQARADPTEEVLYFSKKNTRGRHTVLKKNNVSKATDPEWEGPPHTLKVELDLKGLFGFHVHSRVQ